ncbi:MAG: CDP-diacylglycerol--serine O-phosphatidyltransferase [Syntrophobacteraceae bacterium]
MSAEITKRRSKKKRWRRWEDGEVHRGTYIVPNLFTTANLFSGFFGIVSAINGNFQVAAIAVLISCVFDVLDGKVARFTKATSRFGVEYDSMADLVAFGVGPGLLMYLWALKPFGRLGWLAAFVFVACGALRLARFNVQSETVGKKFFVGLPIPGGASMVATTVLFLHDWKLPFSSAVNAPLLVMTYLLGFLMVSTIPYYSFKDVENVKGGPLPLLLCTIVLLTIVAHNPEVMLFVLVVTYVFSGLIIYLVRRYRGTSNEQGSEPPAAARAEIETPDAGSEK